MMRDRMWDLIELLAVTALIAVFLWVGRRAVPAANVIFGLALLALLVRTHVRSGEGVKELGFRIDTFAAAMRLLLPIGVVAATVIVVAAAADDYVRTFETWPVLRRVATFVVLGIAQQYVLLGFYYRRLTGILQPRLACGAAALIFALLHAPNAFLMMVTFVAGLVACAIYRRAPNLFANGIVHGVLAALLYFALPRDMTHGLRVGADYVAMLLR